LDLTWEEKNCLGFDESLRILKLGTFDLKYLEADEEGAPLFGGVEEKARGATEQYFERTDKLSVPLSWQYYIGKLRNLPRILGLPGKSQHCHFWS
jgi:hypothetical protein